MRSRQIAILFFTTVVFTVFIQVHPANSSPAFLDYNRTFETSELDTVPDWDLVVERYEFFMDFDFENLSFQGIATVTVTNTTESPVELIVLDAASVSLTISGVTSPDSDPYEFTHSDDVLTIDHTIQSGNTETIVITYDGIPEPVYGPFGAMGVFMTGSRAWTFSFPDGAHAWAPVVDDPAMKAEVTWIFGVPEGLTAIANGALTETWADNGKDWFTWEHNHPVCTSEMGFVIGTYAVIEAQTDPFPIRYYVYPGDSTAAAFDMARIPEAVQVFEEIFGYDYPFEELKIVECGVFGGSGGQEHQTMVSLGNQMITGTREFENIIVHEVCHQWFADMVTPVNWDHFWLSEGFAVYSEAIWSEHLLGLEGLLTEIRSDQREYFSWESNGNDYALVNSDYYVTMPSALPYERGSLAIHQLRMRYGDNLFTQAVQNYLTNNAYGYVSSENLRDEFIAATGDSSLIDWFDQWIFQGEVPFFHYAYSEETNELHLKQILDDGDSPSHGNLYDCFMVTFGDTAIHQSVPWDSDNDVMTFRMADWDPEAPEDPELFPLESIPARIRYLNNIETPLLTLSHYLDDETLYPDNVLQPNEIATMTLYIENAGLGLENPSWSLAVDPEDRILVEETEGVMPSIEFLQDKTAMFSIEVIGAGSPDPFWGTVELTITGNQYSETFEIKLALGRSEILLMQDGVLTAIDTLGMILEAGDIVWGTPRNGFENLTESMYETQAVMLEADGRYSDYLFTNDDDYLRDWFTDGGSGCISGEYINLIYPDADPSWLGGIAGTWLGNVSGPAYIGVENDPVADGRIVLAPTQTGVSSCSNCCGGPSIFFALNDSAVAAEIDSDWRILNFGFAFRSLMNSHPATMTRDELVLRTANFLLFREMGFSEDGNIFIPELFEVTTYPNPFNPVLQIQIGIPAASNLNLSVFDLLGRQVAMIHDGFMQAGLRSFHWNASSLSSGTYFLQVQAGNNTSVQRVLLVK